DRRSEVTPFSSVKSCTSEASVLVNSIINSFPAGTSIDSGVKRILAIVTSTRVTSPVGCTSPDLPGEVFHPAALGSKPMPSPAPKATTITEAMNCGSENLGAVVAGLLPVVAGAGGALSFRCVGLMTILGRRISTSVEASAMRAILDTITRTKDGTGSKHSPMAKLVVHTRQVPSRL